MWDPRLAQPPGTAEWFADSPSLSVSLPMVFLAFYVFAVLMELEERAELQAFATFALELLVVRRVLLIQQGRTMMRIFFLLSKRHTPRTYAHCVCDIPLHGDKHTAYTWILVCSRIKITRGLHFRENGYSLVSFVKMILRPMYATKCFV